MRAEYSLLERVIAITAVFDESKSWCKVDASVIRSARKPVGDDFTFAASDLRVGFREPKQRQHRRRERVGVQARSRSDDDNLRGPRAAAVTARLDRRGDQNGARQRLKPPSAVRRLAMSYTTAIFARSSLLAPDGGQGGDGCDQSCAVLGIDIAGERDRRSVAASVSGTRSNLADERITVFIGHSDIADQHSRSEAPEDAESLTDRGNSFHLRASDLEDEGENLSPIRIVFNEKARWSGGRAGLASER